MADNTPTTAAIIVAGGRGRRMAGGTPKQFLKLGARPILAHTLLSFDGCRAIDGIYLVIPEDHWARCQHDVIETVEIKTPVYLVSGGQERQASVYNGLAAMQNRPPKWVVVHDGVRPFVTPGQIETCLAAASEKGAAILATPVADTLKRVSPDGLIAETISRQFIWRAQTPQVFPFDWLWHAHQKAAADGFTATDDAQLLERAGRPVAVVPGGSENLKITTPEDLSRAEVILQSRESQG